METDRGTRRMRISPVVLIVIAILISSALNIWFFAKIDNFQREMDKLSADNINFQNQVWDLIENNTYLQWKVNDLEDDLAKALNLTKRVHISSVTGGWFQKPGVKEGAGLLDAQYAGYLMISLSAFDLEPESYVYVEATYSFGGQLFNFTKTCYASPSLTASGSLIVPILPSEVSIWIGNANLVDRPTIRYSVNYYY